MEEFFVKGFVEVLKMPEGVFKKILVIGFKPHFSKLVTKLSFNTSGCVTNIIIIDI